jgi:hypothetical protein
MRKFASYGPVDKEMNYYVPRAELVAYALLQLIGENPAKGGHYITVWAPRQAGKTWIMREILWILQKDERFDVLKINLEHLKTEEDVNVILSVIGKEILTDLNKEVLKTDSADKFQNIFKKDVLNKPLILILDEFDALAEKAISAIVGVFRNIYNINREQLNLPLEQKKYLLHSVALIGVRSVLGIENAKGSPFNVQRSVHIPDLTFEEVEEMFVWHEKESEQTIDPEVIERLYYETKGQPGLTSWFGELLTEGCHLFKVEKDKHIDMQFFKRVYNAAINALPNNNILNIISKAKQEPYKDILLNMFKTDEKIPFKYDDYEHNFLYMNGVIDIEKTIELKHYMKFPCPFVQKRLFNFFANQITGFVGTLYDPFEDLDDAINETSLNVKNIIKRYRTYLLKNRDWLLKNAPRRSDMKIYEAVFHFNLYMYLSSFINRFHGEIYPEFPTGNGKIDLIIKYREITYGIELKTYTDISGYKEALKQAAKYGKHLGLNKISLIFFVETIDDKNREKYEAVFEDEKTGVKVEPVFVATGD